MDGYAGQRHTEALAHAAGGEGNLELFGGEHGVVVEGLIKIAHPKKQDSVRMVAFDLEVLAANRCHYPTLPFRLHREFYYHFRLAGALRISAKKSN